MEQQQLLNTLNNQPDSVEFADVMAVIEANYDYTPTGFNNGPEQRNEAGTNEGSCKIFAFAKLNQLSETATLACFGKFYREDVLQHPEGNDHGNIRSFMQHGWSGIQFDSAPLHAK